MRQKLDQLADKELVALYREGKTEAFGTLFERHSKHISFIIFKYFKDPTQIHDILHESFIKAMTALKKGTYKEKGAFIAWMTNLTKNFCLDIKREIKRKNISSIYPGDTVPETFSGYYDAIGKDPDPEEALINRENFSNLHFLIDQLPPEQKKVLVLRICYDLSFREICKYAGSDDKPLNLNTCLGRMRYAEKKLKTLAAKAKLS